MKIDEFLTGMFGTVRYVDDFGKCLILLAEALIEFFDLPTFLRSGHSWIDKSMGNIVVGHRLQNYACKHTPSDVPRIFGEFLDSWQNNPEEEFCVGHDNVPPGLSVIKG